MIASLLATAAIVHGSGPPFTYRLGERADREIRVNVKEFRIRNQTKTSNERQAAADQVPPVMVNDPAQILELADRLDDLTVADRQGRLGSRTSATPSARTGSSGPRSSPTIKSAVATPADRDKLHAQIAAAVPAARPRRHPRRRHPAAQRGIEPHPVDPPEGRAAGPRPAWSRASGSSPSGWPSPTGRSTRSSAAAFSPPRIGQVLFGLIAEKFDGTPTLAFEAEATATAREAARARVPDHYDTYHPRRGARRAGPDHRRGAVDPAPAGARRGRRGAAASATASAGRWASWRWSPRSSS